MATERLQQALRNINGQRFYVLFGPGASDFYINTQYLLLDFETGLVETLRDLGFRRTVFWSAGGRVYLRGEEVGAQTPPQAASQGHSAAPGRQRFCRAGPLRGSPVFPASSDSVPLPNARPGGRAYHAIALGHLDSFMCEDTPRTAIIITLPQATFNAIAQDRDLSLLIQDQFHKWEADLQPTNLNCCILVFNVPDYSQLSDIARRLLPFQFLQAPIAAWATDPANQNVARLDPPGKNEIQRLVDYARIRYRLELEWPQREYIIKALAGQSLPGATWLRRLLVLQQRGGRLSAEEVRAMIPDMQGVDPRKKLESLIGLGPVKEKVKELEGRAKGLKEMREVGRKMTAEPPYLHLVFSGNPGTGKTTVAELIGRIYADIGILERGHTVKMAGKDLTGQYEGHTQEKVNQAVNRALDGVLFIDEAYQLAQGGEHGFGQEALNALVDRLSRDRGRLVVIVAGYTKDMDRLLEANVGLPSRFPEENRFEFPDYSPDELWRILQGALSNRDLRIGPELEPRLREIVTQMYMKRPASTWDNARAMEKFAGRILDRYINRHLGNLAENQPLTLEDVPDPDREYLRPAIPEIDKVLQEINQLVGLESIKRWIRQQVHLLQLEELQRRMGVAPDPINMNMAFLGNPGTGKTTVARLMGRVFKALGRLQKGQVVEKRRQDLIGKHIGDTEDITRNVIEKEALDGILFIDEAYDLTSTGSEIDYGPRVVGVLMAAMDHYPDRLAIIAAGYPAPMQQFLESNAGFPRRLGERVRFPDYSDPELLEIMRRMVAKEKFPELHAPVELAVLDYLRAERASDPQHFGNAGAVKTLFARMKLGMASRISGRTSVFNTAEMPPFEVIDVPQFENAPQPGPIAGSRQSFALAPLLSRGSQLLVLTDSVVKPPDNGGL